MESLGWLGVGAVLIRFTESVSKGRKEWKSLPYSLDSCVKVMIAQIMSVRPLFSYLFVFLACT